jgi:hypothetical protein
MKEPKKIKVVLVLNIILTLLSLFNLIRNIGVSPTKSIIPTISFLIFSSLTLLVFKEYRKLTKQKFKKTKYEKYH